MRIITELARTRPERSGYIKFQYEQYLERLKKSKSVIDVGPPKLFPYVNKWKNEYNISNKKIEDENRKMVNRIIYSTNAGIDNDLDTYIEDYAYFKRKMIIQKNIFDTNLINEQNKLLTKRLENTKSCYNRQEWEKDYQKRKQLLKVMSIFS
jgi:hypothetical protein